MKAGEEMLTCVCLGKSAGDGHDFFTYVLIYTGQMHILGPCPLLPLVHPHLLCYTQLPGTRRGGKRNPILIPGFSRPPRAHLILSGKEQLNIIQVFFLLRELERQTTVLIYRMACSCIVHTGNGAVSCSSCVDITVAISTLWGG